MAAKRQIESISAFYDAIASDYNSYLTRSDEQVRNEVSQLFINHVQQGTVLDFGGGTGLDLPWLVQNFKHVYFLEPSTRMRAVAEQNSSSRPNVTFIRTGTNFNEWKSESLPLTEKVGGIIANFAVLNCIQNLDQFFEKIAWVADDSCQVILTIIDPRPQMILKNYSAATAIRTLFTDSLTILQQHKGVYHDTYIHSLSSIKKASSKRFIFKGFIPLTFSTFAVLIFSKR